MTDRQYLVSRVKALAETLEGSDVSELDLTEGGTRVLIRRRLEGAPVEVPVAVPRKLVQRSTRAHRAQPGRAAIGEAAAPNPDVAVVAPLTGVFYSSASPTSAPFVQVGDTIQAGQVACIVEAMKVFNEIKSEVSGTVTAIVAKNGQLVQKGDALIRVKPVS
jgi:acetyl-CoA carboxylase biotin carboxyl carrier protein